MYTYNIRICYTSIVVLCKNHPVQSMGNLLVFLVSRQNPRDKIPVKISPKTKSLSDEIPLDKTSVRRNPPATVSPYENIPKIEK